MRKALSDYPAFLAALKERILHARNLRDMKRMWLAFSDGPIWPQAVAKSAGKRRQAVAQSAEKGGRAAILQQLVAEVPWGHHRLILDKLGDPAARLYYFKQYDRWAFAEFTDIHRIEDEFGRLIEKAAQP